ncbi:hypothetical protein [Pasteurella multocida]|uniref:hypothetical protein n=1 Tax=Pasteurella multocida TaxID=747 RepID=UPI0023014EE4|nr:hypothetical protein [Pasteurella multocida]MDA5611667.1 hypothetical protein [Pasteurella multocida]MDA5614124.1 hypothetical protein [Pasteurella multocida]
MYTVEDCYQRLVEKAKKKDGKFPPERVLYKIINAIFFDNNHCKTAYESEKNRKQYPSEFKNIV